MDELQAQSFVDYVRKVEDISANARLVLFRGQAIRRNLLPKIARSNPKFNSESKEREMLSELRRIGGAFLSDAKESDWDLLVLAQHFGMSTRLLDWTSNPLAALWFACSSEQQGDCYVYFLIADGLITSTSSKSPFDQAKTRVFQPRLNNPRIVAQDGWFTAHRYSGKPGRFFSLERIRDVMPYLTEVLIPAESRLGMLRSLDRHGITSRVLFPDLEGLCRYLTWKYGLDFDDETQSE